MTDENKSEEKTEEKPDPWDRIQNIVKKAVGEEFSKWEISQSDSQPSEPKKETDPPQSSPSTSPTPERRKGFLENFFGIQS